MNKIKLFVLSFVSASFISVAAYADGHAVEACLITKTDINPFFVKMKEGAEARAQELGVKLSFFVIKQASTECPSAYAETLRKDAENKLKINSFILFIIPPIFEKNYKNKIYKSTTNISNFN